MRFSSIDPADPDREASLVIDVSTQNYKGAFSFVPDELLPDSHFLVITSSPPLLSMSILVNNLKETGDVYTFIRDVRAAYKILVCCSFPCLIKVLTRVPA